MKAATVEGGVERPRGNIKTRGIAILVTEGMLATPARVARDFYQSLVASRSDHKRPHVDVDLLRVDSELPTVCHFEHGVKHGGGERKGKRRR